MRLTIFLPLWLTASILCAAESGTNDHIVNRSLSNAVPLVMGGNDSNIAKVVATILEKGHYLRQPFNDEISSRFLDRYLDELDNLHIYFTEEDVKEFDVYRTSLDDLILKEGDTEPGIVIFKRFRERIQQQSDYVTYLLKNENFTFTNEDRFPISRRGAPRPKNLDEAKKLWRDRLRYEYLEQKLDKKKPAEILDLISRRYSRILRLFMEYDADDVLQRFLSSLARVYDPHSEYMGKPELDNFSINMKLRLFGIGALLSSEDGYCKIKELKPGPAFQSKKLKVDDRIVAVAQGDEPPVDVVDMKLNKVVELIRGQKGTEVRLTVIPADAPDPSVRKVVSLIRAEIKLEDQEAKAKLFEEDLGNGKTTRWGVIDLPSFYSAFELAGQKTDGESKSTTTDVAKLLKKLMDEHVDGVILDLRRNGGGALDEAINLTGLFIPEGPVVQVRDYNGTPKIESDTNPEMLYKGPLIVLTSRFSASASEILAGALQDYGRAVIVGDSSTHGKGTVQILHQLAPFMRQLGAGPDASNAGAFKVTIRKFYRASGSSTQLKGVTPDVVLPSVNNFLETGESSLTNRLEWDTIKSAKYTKLDMVQQYLEELRKRSEKRTLTDQDFLYIRDDIERYKKSLAENSVSLNEQVRLKEKQEAEARAKARKKEIASRAPLKEKVWDLTLKLAAEPGLPAPNSRTNLVKKVETIHPELNPGKTNSVVASPNKPKDDEEAEEAGTPPVDATLVEAGHILFDLIQLSEKDGHLAGSAAANTTAK